MLDHEKAPASVGALDEAGSETSGALISYNQNTTRKPKMQGRIAELLPHGEANAIPAKELAALVSAPSVRALQSRIARECEETDALILSTVVLVAGLHIRLLWSAFGYVALFIPSA